MTRSGKANGNTTKVDSLRIGCRSMCLLVSLSRATTLTHLLNLLALPGGLGERDRPRWQSLKGLQYPGSIAECEQSVKVIFCTMFAIRGHDTPNPLEERLILSSAIIAHSLSLYIVSVKTRANKHLEQGREGSDKIFYRIEEIEVNL